MVPCDVEPCDEAFLCRLIRIYSPQDDVYQFDDIDIDGERYTYITVFCHDTDTFDQHKAEITAQFEIDVANG